MMQWWPHTTERGTYYATLGEGDVRIYRDGELVATAPQQYGKSGDYVVTLTDGTVVATTNWLRHVVAIAARAVEEQGAQI